MRPMQESIHSKMSSAGQSKPTKGTSKEISRIVRTSSTPNESRLGEKPTEVSSPRKRGSIPCEHKLDSRRVESSTHFRGNDKTGSIDFYTVSIPSGKEWFRQMSELRYREIELLPWGAMFIV